MGVGVCMCRVREKIRIKRGVRQGGYHLTQAVHGNTGEHNKVFKNWKTRACM